MSNAPKQEILPPEPVADAPRHGGFQPGREKTGGREKGTPNQITADLKAMIVGALNDAGGQNYLLFHAMVNPQLFIPLVGKILPLKITPGEGEVLVEYHYLESVPMEKPK